MKRCFKCLCEKPLDDFYKHSAMGDGRLNKCKDCTKRDVSEHRIANIERVRAYDKMRASAPHRVKARKEYQSTDAGRIASVEAKKRWSDRNPDRRRAMNAVNKAIRKGGLTKLPCESCGASDAEGHHPHYDMPLVVVWLCDAHHKEVHRMTREVACEPHHEGPT